MTHRDPSVLNDHPAGPLPGFAETSPTPQNGLGDTPLPALDLARRPLSSRSAWFLGGFWVLGILAATREILAIPSAENADAFQTTNLLIDAVFQLVAFGLLGFLVVAFLDLMGRLVERLPQRTGEAFAPSEVERWMGVLDRLAGSNPQPVTGEKLVVEASPGPRTVINEIRKAIQSEAWDEAVGLMEIMRATDPADPDLAKLTEEYEHHRRVAIERQLRAIEVAKEVSDGSRVIELYQQVAVFLEPDAHKTLEDELAKWFMKLVQRRLRTGIIQPEVVTLATQISEIFVGTVEGASLRASLPTLRRAVGLCPRCGTPYTGVENACPECLSAK